MAGYLWRWRCAEKGAGPTLSAAMPMLERTA